MVVIIEQPRVKPYILLTASKKNVGCLLYQDIKTISEELYSEE